MTARTVRRAAAAALLVVAAVPAALRAQGNLSVQGLGYPPGQLSARALGTAGALGELDPGSTLNPAALIEFGAPTLSMSMAPEFRKVTANGTTSNSSTQRFPVFVGALPFGQRVMIGVSSSTLLDRTWQTTTPSEQIIAPDTVRFNSTATSDGSMNDIAFTVAYAVRPWLRVGVAAHAINGRDVVTVRRTFEDTVRYGNTVEPVDNTYSGNALSAGLELVSPSLGGFALSYRRGGSFEQTVGDTLINTARVPNQFGMGFVFSGLANTNIAARTTYDSWSSFGSIDSQLGSARNSWDTSVGIEATGPALGSIPLSFRAGVRQRDLPFPADGHQVRESSFSGGMGMTLANGRALFDFAAVHSARSAGIAITESAWTVSMGLTIRP
jgi:hypothetical protein